MHCSDALRKMPHYFFFFFFFFFFFEIAVFIAYKSSCIAQKPNDNVWACYIRVTQRLALPSLVHAVLCWSCFEPEFCLCRHSLYRAFHYHDILRLVRSYTLIHCKLNHQIKINDICFFFTENMA